MRENQWVEKYLKGDKVIWLILFFLSMASVLIVYSTVGALAYRQLGGNTWYYFWKQIGFTLGGFFVVGLLVHYSKWFMNFLRNLALPLLIVSVLLVIIALVYGRHGASGRTIPLGILTFQPAEVVKITLALFISSVLCKSQGSREELRRAFFISMIATCLTCSLIFLADFSTSVIIFASVLVMLWVGRVPWIYLAGTIGSMALFCVLIYFAVELSPEKIGKIGRLATVHNRIERFVSSNDIKEQERQKAFKFTQADYAKMAIANGGFLFGQGIGDSKYANLMSAAYNDFVYAIFLEEYGGLFGIFILLLFFILLTRGGVIIGSSKRVFPAFLTAGLVFQLVFQAMINMGVAVGLLPVTGQPLPWVSMGGSSRLLTAAAFGLILCASVIAKEDNALEKEQGAGKVEKKFIEEDAEMV